MKYRILKEESIYNGHTRYCIEKETELGWVMVDGTMCHAMDEIVYRFDRLMEGIQPIKKTIIREVEV